jgi:GNAT superfamily N-acetyltransferase
MLSISLVNTAGDELNECRQLFAEYQQALGVDLCFQGFAEELANPLLKYGPPNGALFLACWNGAPVGCIALHPLPGGGACEMKRLYVRPAFRQHDIGRQLVERLLLEAATVGYSVMKLDTLSKLQPAIKLYQAYGFTDVTAYYHNPLEDVVYMEKQLLADGIISPHPVMGKTME